MNPESEIKLHRLLGGDALAGLRRTLRRRFERMPAEAPPGSIRLGNLTAAEHEALALLTGRPARYRRSMAVDLAALDGALQRAGLAESLRAALEHLDGEIADRTALERDEHDRWSAIKSGVVEDGLAVYLSTGPGLGLLKRLARRDSEAAQQICQAAQAVLRRLPARGLPRARLAAETLGDAHGLDTGRAVATLVLAVLRRRNAGPALRRDDAISAGESLPDEMERMERVRAVWARAGVLVNELARPALFLNLPVCGGASPAAAGEPGFASLRWLLRSSPQWDVAGRVVHVCENPNFLAIAADRLGADCAPLVSTDGMPAAAQRTLLSQLSAGGALLAYHGDFDWPGLRIGGRVMAEFRARPWRFSSMDYEQAVMVSADYRQRLTGTAVGAEWDEKLATSMRRIGLAVHEEALAEQLLPDLAQCRHR